MIVITVSYWYDTFATQTMYLNQFDESYFNLILAMTSQNTTSPLIP